MILIISNYNDETTTEVLKWLKFFNSNYIRINNFNFSEKDISINLSDNTPSIYYNFTRILKIWNRKGIEIIRIKRNFYEEKLEKHLNSEIDIFTNILNNLGVYINDSIGFNCNSDFLDMNKIRVLRIANSLGIKIPKLITIFS